MARPRRRALRAPLLAAAIALATAACIDRTPPAGPQPARAGVALPAPSDAMVVLYPEDLAPIAATGGTLTELLRRRVPGLHVDRAAQVGACPRFVLRGYRSLVLDSEPIVFVDGIRHWDTCILERLPAADVAAVEVYAGGRGGGSLSNPGGAIVVYTHRR